MFVTVNLFYLISSYKSQSERIRRTLSLSNGGHGRLRTILGRCRKSNQGLRTTHFLVNGVPKDCKTGPVMRRSYSTFCRTCSSLKRGCNCQMKAR